MFLISLLFLDWNEFLLGQHRAEHLKLVLVVRQLEIEIDLLVGSQKVQV